MWFHVSLHILRDYLDTAEKYNDLKINKGLRN